jgi:hypothetical protein
MEMSDQPHAPVTLLLGKELLTLIGWEAGWMNPNTSLNAVEISLPGIEHRIPVRRARSSVSILIHLSIYSLALSVVQNRHIERWIIGRLLNNE